MVSGIAMNAKRTLIPSRKWVRLYFAMITITMGLPNRRALMFQFLLQTVPWYAWLLLWPIVAMVFAPFVGRVLKRRREALEREQQHNAQWKASAHNRWLNESDEQWEDAS